MPRSSPAPYLFLSQLHKQVSRPSGTCTCEVQSRHPLAAALSCSIGGVLSSASMRWSRKLVLCYTGSQWSPGRHMFQESGFSVRASEKQKSAFSIPSHSLVGLRASPTNLCLVWQAPAHLHELSSYTLSSGPQGCYLTIDHMASSSLLSQAAWQNPLLFQPTVILNAQPGPSYVTS